MSAVEVPHLVWQLGLESAAELAAADAAASADVGVDACAGQRHHGDPQQLSAEPQARTLHASMAIASSAYPHRYARHYPKAKLPAGSPPRLLRKERLRHCTQCSEPKQLSPMADENEP